MSRDRNPAGIPSGPIVNPMYGTGDFNAVQRVGGQHAGFVRVRRSFAVSSGVVAFLVVLVAIFGKWSSATGMAYVMLAPLLFILACTHMAVVITRPTASKISTESSK